MIGADAQDFQNAKVQIESVINALAESWNRHDMTLFGAQFADDADFVNVLGMHWHGRPLIEEQHAAVHRTIFRNSMLKILEHSVRPLTPDVVLAHIQWEMTGHESPPGVPFEKVRHGVMTGVFVEREERWVIGAMQNTEVVPVPAPWQKP
jgi:uncharacterized protein (TIGR02246 family)